MSCWVIGYSLLGGFP